MSLSQELGDIDYDFVYEDVGGFFYDFEQYSHDYLQNRLFFW